MKKFFLGAAFEWSIAILFLAYLLSYDAIGLPSVEELLRLIEVGFQNWGLLFLFVGLVLEGLFVVGFYAPGSTVAILSVLVLGDTATDVLLIIITGSAALVLVNIFNYILGKHGYYRLLAGIGAKNTIARMQRRFEKSEKGFVFLFGSSPNFLAIASIYAGIVRKNLWHYARYMSLVVVFWVSLVSGALFIFFQDLTLSEVDNIGWYALGIVMAWAIAESIIEWRRALNQTLRA